MSVSRDVQLRLTADAAHRNQSVGARVPGGDDQWLHIGAQLVKQQIEANPSEVVIGRTSHPAIHCTELPRHHRINRRLPVFKVVFERSLNLPPGTSVTVHAGETTTALRNNVTTINSSGVAVFKALRFVERSGRGNYFNIHIRVANITATIYDAIKATVDGPRLGRQKISTCKREVIRLMSAPDIRVSKHSFSTSPTPSTKSRLQASASWESINACSLMPAYPVRRARSLSPCNSRYDDACSSSDESDGPRSSRSVGLPSMDMPSLYGESSTIHDIISDINTNMTVMSHFQEFAELTVPPATLTPVAAPTPGAPSFNQSLRDVPMDASTTMPVKPVTDASLLSTLAALLEGA